MDPYLNPQSKLDHDLVDLRDDVLRLSSMVDKAIGESVRALGELNTSLAQDIIADDESINLFRFQIEQKCHQMLFLQQPTARDMRSVITAIHIAIELERIADHAAGISKLTIQLAQQPLIKPLVDIPKMCNISRKMLEDSLDAYVHWNSDLAHEVFKRDDLVDDLDKLVFKDLIDLMLDNPQNITGGTYLLWVAHNLERIADRITNICERVIFMVTGELMLEEQG